MRNSYPEFSQFRELPAWGFYVRHACGVVFDNVKLKAAQKDYRPAIVIQEAEDITLKKMKYKEPKGGKKQVHAQRKAEERDGGVRRAYRAARLFERPFGEGVGERV